MATKALPSLTLTEAMGINPPSLYAAFGNKEGLFRRALDRYVQQRTGFWNEALAAPTARGMIAHLLRESANFLTEKCNPPGCLLVRGALSCSEAADCDCWRACSPAHRW